MAAKTLLFPTAEVNLFAKAADFVSSWEKFFPYDEEYHEYRRLLEKDGCSLDELMMLFAYFNGRSLTDAEHQAFMRTVAPYISRLNNLRLNRLPGSIYSLFTGSGIDSLWFNYLLHVFGRLPLLNDDIFRAYWFINYQEVKEKYRSTGALGDTYDEFFQFQIGMRNMYSEKTEEHWQNAMIMFGRFLKHFRGRTF